ncbi:Glyoxalase/Bleomycin resistance protein/Dihydroxybiphenyl dioxygenase [Elaphomyces granulatus]
MPSKIDHIGLVAPRDKFDEVVAWYKKVLAPLKYDELRRYPGVVGLGADGIPDFWITARDGPLQSGIHLAFQAPDHATVDAFYNAAIEAGSTDNGKPGLRPQYHPNYYAAFVVDPLGNNFELVHHGNCNNNQ